MRIETKKFKVTMREVVVYVLEVEAENEDEAREAAGEMFVQSEKTDRFFSHVADRCVIDVGN